ncbi:unnamed protein product [Periconia digitata]|uniref:Uncharacterized protein n=1 Tax=Periconia digitata TaxID=1303443 RepID=A0A9W4U120_9PLEO|nr:unnamed protein product [Periconia digitata]
MSSPTSPPTVAALTAQVAALEIEKRALEDEQTQRVQRVNDGKEKTRSVAPYIDGVELTEILFREIEALKEKVKNLEERLAALNTIAGQSDQSGITQDSVNVSAATSSSTLTPTTSASQQTHTPDRHSPGRHPVRAPEFNRSCNRRCNRRNCKSVHDDQRQLYSDLIPTLPKTAAEAAARR